MKACVYLTGLILGIFGFTPWAGATTCNCTVSHPSGSPSASTSCTLAKLIAATDCPSVSLSPALVGDIEYNGQIKLSGDRRLVGNGHTAIVAKSASVSALIQISGTRNSTEPTLENLWITGNGKTGVQFDATAHGQIVKDVVIEKCDIGILGQGEAGSIKGSQFKNNTAAVQLLGKNYILEGNRFISNSGPGILLSKDAINNRFITNEYEGNGAGIILNGGNGNIPAPFLVRMVKTGDAQYTLFVGAVGMGIVKAYLADAGAAQGKSFLADQEDLSQIKLEPFFPSGFANLYRLDIQENPSKAIVLITHHDSYGTSAFSKLTPAQSAPQDLSGPDCVYQEWFTNSVIQLGNTNDPSSVWSLDYDGDTFTNDAEDPDHNCIIDFNKNESNPGDKGSFPKPADTDGDGIADKDDKCITVANANNGDMDKDGIGDACDDSDGDKTVDAEDLCPTVGSANPKTDTVACQDSDGDLKYDPVDNCPNQHNVDQKDTDMDGAGDACDRDADNDGLADVEEKALPKLDFMNPDSDSDGYCDGPAWGFVHPQNGKSCKPEDNCPFNQNSNQTDKDEDGIGDVCDLDPLTSSAIVDSDKDGVMDAVDTCPTFPNPLQEAGAVKVQADLDGDGVGDICDADDDQDGLDDATESAGIYFLQGIVKNLDFGNPDSDGDTFCDGMGPGFKSKCKVVQDSNGNVLLDYCPFVKDAALKNCAHIDNILSAEDADGDKVVDFIPGAPSDNCISVRNVNQRDLDGDSNGDACDEDDDNDGVKDWAEAQMGTKYWDSDSDGDGFCDGNLAGFLSKFDASMKCKLSKDASGKALGDNCPANYNPDQDPADCAASKKGTVDDDKDGVADGMDNCPVFNPEQTNTDGDAQGDICDADDDNDGVVDGADSCPLSKDPNCVAPNPSAGAGTGQGTSGFQGGNFVPQVEGGRGCSLIATGSTSFWPFITLAPAILFLRRRRKR